MLLGLAVAQLSVACIARRLGAQTEYFNLDANRPTRVEDAIPTARYDLDLQFGTLRLDRFAQGTRRWRTEPKVSYGIAPLTELELRMPVVYVQPAGQAAQSAMGVASVGLGGMHAFSIEHGAVPAVALSAELLLAAGSQAPQRSSYAVKALITKTTWLARVHLNGSYGTYAVRAVPPQSSADTLCGIRGFVPSGFTSCTGSGPTIPDLPCDVVPMTSPILARAVEPAIHFSAAIREPPATPSRCIGSAATAAVPLVNLTRSVGPRWFAGVALDRAFPLHSTLLIADLFAERLVGLYNLTDWTAEVGFRHQWSPRIVVDAGVVRHFAGVLQSTAATLGVTCALAVRPRPSLLDASQ